MVKSIASRIRRFCVASTVLFGGLFLISGAWTDPWLWTYVIVWMGLLLYALLGVDDDLARERFSPPTRGADRVWLAAVQITAVAHLVIGALDLGRWHLGHVPPLLRTAAFLGMGGAGLLVFRAMRSNRFFSSVVRIQEDRGHRVVDNGPYSRVRHPGYAGMIPLMALSGLALGSWPAFGLGLVYGALIFRRVAFEDRFLQANLAGYRDYAGRVRYRLVPGIW